MTQATLAPVSVDSSASIDDPLVDIAKQFNKCLEDFLDHFNAIIASDIDDTLYDVMYLREASGHIQTGLNLLGKLKTTLQEKAEEVLETCVITGRIQEGNLKVVSVEKVGKRSVDEDLLKQKRPDVYELLLNTKIESIKVEYRPTIQEIKAIFKKQHELYLKPGEITITYDIEVIV